MKEVILWIWQLPQHLVAMFVFLANINNVEKMEYGTKLGEKGITFYRVKHCFNCSVSLGRYIFTDKDRKLDEMTIKHEYGHSKQSLMLGWFYLLVVGLTSAIGNNLYDRLFHKDWTQLQRHLWYYHRFPERWADRLGEVKRLYTRG